MLQSDSSYRSGNNENYGKGYEETGFPLNGNFHKQDCYKSSKKTGKDDFSQQERLYGVWRLDLPCVHNSLNKENVFKRLLAAINMAYVQ